MALDGISQLGEKLGKSSSQQTEIQENISPDDAIDTFNLNFSEEEVTDGVLTITKKNYDSTSFILDHPIQGEIDSAVYKLDGGYGGTSGMQMPMAMPIPFIEGAPASEVLRVIAF